MLAEEQVILFQEFKEQLTVISSTLQYTNNILYFALILALSATILLIMYSVLKKFM